ncbi:MAG: pentapeptide repeat-containing protein [Cyanobacteria bacterium J06632_3]
MSAHQPQNSESSAPQPLEPASLNDAGLDAEKLAEQVDFYELEQIFDKLYAYRQDKNTFFHREIAFHNIERTTEISVEQVRSLYSIYCSYKKRTRLNQLWRVWHRLSQTFSGYTVKLVGGITVVAAVLGFLFQVNQFRDQFLRSNDLRAAENELEREKSIAAAWQTLDEYSGRAANFGRLGALERLAAEDVSLDGIDVAGANLNRLNLSVTYLAEIRSERDPEADQPFWANLFQQAKDNLSRADNNVGDLELCASLERADFRGAQLQRSNLACAVLYDSDFGPYLRSSNGGAIAKESSVTASAEGDSNSDGQASIACLRKKDQEQRLGESADLTHAILAGTDFTNARLDYAVLTKANFTAANLTGVTLECAEVEAVNFSDVEERTSAQDLANRLLGIYPAEEPGQPDLKRNPARNWKAAFYTSILRSQEGLCGAVNLMVPDYRKGETANKSADAPIAPIRLSRGTNRETILAVLAAYFERRKEEQKKANDANNIAYPIDLSCYSFVEFVDNHQDVFHELDLTGIDFNRSDLDDLSLKGKTITDVDFSGARLQRTDLSETILQNVDLAGAILSGANLRGATLARVTLVGANLRHVNLTGIDREMLNRNVLTLIAADPLSEPALINWRYALYDAEIRANEQLCGQVFFVMQETTNPASPVLDLNRNDLTTALSRYFESVVSDSPNLSCYSFKEQIGTDYFSNRTLLGVDFQRSNLKALDFSQSNLRDSNFFEADLSDANLSQANLQGVNLQDAVLTRSNLSQANLTGATLQGANLYYADLSGIPKDQIDLGALSRAKNKNSAVYSSEVRNVDGFCGDVRFLVKGAKDGRDMILGHAPGGDVTATAFQDFLQRLRQADLTDLSCLSFAEFGKTDSSLYFSGADFSGLKLSRSNFNQIDFGTANLTDANLYLADLQGADLSRVQGLEAGQLANACNVDQAILDPELQTELDQELEDRRAGGESLPCGSA